MGLIKKGTKLYGMIHWKCPRCHEGDLYATSVFSFSKPFGMPDHCPHCGQKYVIEPGFYWGAMYIDYMLSSAVMLSVFAVFYFLVDWSVWPAFFAALAVASLLYVVIFRTGRAIWINLFVKYNPPPSDQAS